MCIRDRVVTGRVKHYFSIYRKMVTQNKTLDQIYDIFAARIIVKTEKDCYAALGVIHDMYKPIPGRFKDCLLYTSRYTRVKQYCHFDNFVLLTSSRLDGDYVPIPT